MTLPYETCLHDRRALPAYRHSIAKETKMKTYRTIITSPSSMLSRIRENMTQEEMNTDLTEYININTPEPGATKLEKVYSTYSLETLISHRLAQTLTVEMSETRTVWQVLSSDANVTQHSTFAEATQEKWRSPFGPRSVILKVAQTFSASLDDWEITAVELVPSPN